MERSLVGEVRPEIIQKAQDRVKAVLTAWENEDTHFSNPTRQSLINTFSGSLRILYPNQSPVRENLGWRNIISEISATMERIRELEFNRLRLHL